MNFSILISDSRPSTNYALEIRKEDKLFSLNVAGQKVKAKNKIAAFLSLLGYYASISVQNSPYEMEIYVAVTENVLLEGAVFDYSSASQSDKDTVDAFVNLLAELTPAQ